MIEELIKEKGNLTIAALTLNELKLFMDSYKEKTSTIREDDTSEFPSDLVNQSELSKELNISVSTLYRLRKEGQVPEYQVGKKAMFSIKEVKETLLINVVKSSSSSFLK